MRAACCWMIRTSPHWPCISARGKGISYLPQEASVFRKLSVEDNLMAILQTRRDLNRRERYDRMNQLIAQLGLDQVRKSKGYVLSGGERRRVEIARSLVIEPSFLLLDEPFSGIDPIQVLELQKDYLRSQALRNRDSGNRSQRARNAGRDGSRLHHQ